MDYPATLAKLNEAWKPLISSFDKKALKHIGGKENKEGILLGVFSLAYHKREKLIKASSIFYGYAYKTFMEEKETSSIQKPTWVLFSPAREFQDNPEKYKEILDIIQAFLAKNDAKGKEKNLQVYLSSPYSDINMFELPSNLTNGSLVYLSIVYQKSSNMPFFHLGINLFLANLSVSKELLYLPGEYWNEEYSSFYQTHSL